MHRFLTPIETRRVFTSRDMILFGCLTASIYLLLIWFSLYWFRLEAWSSHLLLYTVATAALFINFVCSHVSWWLLPRMKRPVPRPSPHGLRVGVATTFVPGAEDLQMLACTLRALLAMDYPHDTWVLDEGNNPQVQALCRQLGAHHFSRKEKLHYQQEAGPFKSRTKYGNVNAWLHELAFKQYDIVACFDPDHVPHHEFLTRTLGYFDSSAIGYVQAAQVYYNQDASFIARGAAEETYYYYSSLQMASFSAGYPIVTGCHNIHRVSALQAVGGFAPHDADDLLITLHYRAQGWHGVYVPEALAYGLTPVDWHGYLQQQLRWARSVLDIKLHILPKLSRQFPPATRFISFLHGLNYLFEPLLTLIFIVLLVGQLIWSEVPLLHDLTRFPVFVTYAGLFAIDFFRQRFLLDPRHERGLYWRSSILRHAKWPIMIRAVIEASLNRKVPYTLTNKAERAGRAWALWQWHLVAVLFLLGAWQIGLSGGQTNHISTHIFLAVSLAVTMGLITTDFIRFPKPYNYQLQTQALAKRYPEVLRCWPRHEATQHKAGHALLDLHYFW